MSILRICRECGFSITDDPRIARGQAICCCIKPKEGLAAIITSYNSKEEKWVNQCKETKKKEGRQGGDGVLLL